MSGFTGSAVDTGIRADAGGSKYPNPFFDISSAYMPKSISELFQIGEFMMTAVQPFMTVTQRVMSYFVTEIEVAGPSDQECEDRKLFLSNKMHIIEKLIDIGVNWMTYGNVFVSVYFPFDRYLTCTQCGLSLKADRLDYKYDASLVRFDAGECPKCKSRGARRCDDRRSPDTDRSRIILWNPKRIRLRMHPVSGRKEIYMSLDQKLVERIRAGSKFHINDTPMSMLKAIAAVPTAGGTGGEVIYKFADGAVYHMAGTALSGSGVQGWGLPPILSSIKNAYYVQLLRRYDEAIAHDFIVPLRFLFPKSGAGAAGGDPLMNTNLGAFRANLQSMIRRHRQRPDEYYVAPCDVGYTMIGGEAKLLAPKENIMAASDETLNNLGFPAELWRGTTQLQVLPAALRLFERYWSPLVGGMNSVLKFVDTRTANHFMWDEADTKLRSITLADDIERKALLLQAAAGGVVSNTTAYAPLDVDYKKEQKRIIDEQNSVARLQAAAESEQAAQNDATAEGPPVAAQTPGDIREEASAIANQLLTQVPENMRRGELAKIRASNPTLHALVKQEMETIRNEWARQGQAGMQQQATAAAQAGQ